MSKPTPKWYRAQLAKESREKLAREAASDFVQWWGKQPFVTLEQVDAQLASAFLAFAESVERAK